ncbi:winged helix-turn-helix transcriptional regulator [Cochlodiniinecator piscidefendens]|uniref:winged helix-turn-helix transcriptional regulator n=1 Tax=Cochlodiniinecator piscidefendens TaxID=2715756 RepID=UPI002F3F6AC8
MFVNITSRAWSLPILANLHLGVPGRQAALISATGANRTAFAKSMTHLMDLELLERNPGYGHPLRPEFRLTQLGAVMAKAAAEITSLSDAEGQRLIRRNWTVPVLTTLLRPNQFSVIKKDLATISDRALSETLRSMEDKNWVHRSVDHEARPPRPLYQAVNSGALISSAACQVISPV